MNVKELKAALADLPDDMLIEVPDPELGPAYAWTVAHVDTIHYGSCMLMQDKEDPENATDS